MTYRSDLDALTARHDALEAEVENRKRELDQTRSLLDETRAKARLPVLDNIRVAAPCTASWAAMQGDERVRFCGECKTPVFNLSDMTREEAEAVLFQRQGKLCARYYRRADGTIITKDCSVGVRRRRRRRLFAAGLAGTLLGGLLGYKLHKKAAEDVEMGKVSHMGEVSMPQEMGQVRVSPAEQPVVPSHFTDPKQR